MPTHLVITGVWQVDLPWTNAWILSDGRDAVLIDTGTRWDRTAVVAALNHAMPDGIRLRSILLTHAHCDHAGNAAFLAERFGAKIFCHSLERPFMATRRTYVPRGFRALSLSGFLFTAGELVFPVSKREPDTLISNSDSIDTPLGVLKIVETPGHTPGHASYFLEEKGWLFSGDALINIIPWSRTVGLSLPMRVFTSNMQLGIESAWKISDLAPTALFAGHGPPLLRHTANEIASFMERNAQRAEPAGISERQGQ